jgi:hypothetical protein
VTQTPTTTPTPKLPAWAWALVGLLVGAAVVMAVLIAGPGALAKFRACKATDLTGAQLTCLSAVAVAASLVTHYLGW